MDTCTQHTTVMHILACQKDRVRGSYSDLEEQESMDNSVTCGEYLEHFLLLHSVYMCLQVDILLPSGAHLCHL